MTKKLPEEPVSLSRVQDRIADLLSDLNATVEDVQKLANLGDEQRALQILEQQRASMYELVDQISREVSTSTPTRWALLSRHMSAAAVAALFAIGAVGMSISALNRPGDAVNDATVQLEKAAHIADPETRLQIIVKVYESTRALPASERQAIDSNLREQARNIIDEGGNDADDPTVFDKAEEIAEDLSEGKPPPPPPAPSGDRPPTDVVNEVLPNE